MKQEWTYPIIIAAACYLQFVLAGINLLNQSMGGKGAWVLLTGIPASAGCGLLLRLLQKGRRWMRQHRPGDWAVLSAVGTVLAIFFGIAACIITLIVLAAGSAMGGLKF